MKVSAVILIIFFVAISTLFIGYRSSEFTSPPEPMKLEIPDGWPKPPSNIFSKNKLTKEGFELGKKLFHDGRLSRDNMVSCGSCHQQFAAFATFDHDLSHGVDNKFTTRNAPGLFNLAWMKEYHWDGGANHIESQALSPITAHNEMGEDIGNVISKLNADTSYHRMFREAFGDPAITSQRILRALAQFSGSLISSNSKYDMVMRGQAEFTRYELRGYEIFKANCNTCHKEPLFTDNSFRNNGGSLNRFNDEGRKMISGKSKDSLKFKVPSLRNTQVTFPYFHDGSIYSVPQVIDHYLALDTTRKDIDPILQKKITLTKGQKNDLVYFLYTLTDSTFLRDPKFKGNSNIFH